jgi:hypothetical protein
MTITTTRRAPTDLRWRIICTISAYAALAKVPYHKLFSDVDAIVEACTVGLQRAKALFGPDVTYAPPNIAMISYGHLNCLGAPLHFVEGGEVGFEPFCDSLPDAIGRAQRTIDWASAGQMPFYLDLWRRVQARFPEHRIRFANFRGQGPITTAWAMRGQAFFLDVFDDPAGVAELLQAVVHSIISFQRFLDEVNHRTASPAVLGLTDDLAAFLRPSMWDTLVMPALESYFNAHPTARRQAHIENLTPEHLHYLDDLKLDQFDPSVSPRITPADLRDRCGVDFLWLLHPMQVRDFTRQQVVDWAREATRDGACLLDCHLEAGTLNPQAIENAQTFIQSARALCTRPAR